MWASVEFVPRFRGGLIVNYVPKWRSRQGQIYNDAMAVLLYLVNNPNEYHDKQQSYRTISEATGIPSTSLKRMIKWHCKHGTENCVLHWVAFKAGITINYTSQPGRVMFAQYITAEEQRARRDTGNGGPLY
jgi:hypothetical protein